MSISKAEKRQMFWNINLNGYEKKVLKEAGFIIPEQLMSMPIISLVHLDGLGYPCALDILTALCEYFEIESDEFPEYIKKLFELFDDDDYEEDDYCDGCLSKETEVLISVDEILYQLGYTDAKKISQITVQELLYIKGMNMDILPYIAEEIVKTYYKTFHLPTYKFKSRDDFRLNNKLFFENPK